VTTARRYALQLHGAARIVTIDGDQSDAPLGTVCVTDDTGQSIACVGRELRHIDDRAKVTS
jgi:lactam utilization protein B